MTYLPHPARALFLAATAHSRAHQTRAHIEQQLKGSSCHSAKHRKSMIKWIEGAETSGLNENDDLLNFRLRLFKPLAEQVLYAEEHSLFDVADLLSKLPRNDISTFSLSNLVLPGDETIFIHLGRQDALVVNDQTDLYIEGAYVTQIDQEDCDEEKSSFRVVLVYSDASFEGEALDRPFGRTLCRNTGFVRFEIDHTATVQQGLATLAENGDRGHSKIMTVPFPVCREAYDLVVRSMIYLGLQGRDLEIGFFEGAQAPQAKKALKGNNRAIDDLLAEGFPMVQFVGRNIEHVAELEEPDWGSQTFGFVG